MHTPTRTTFGATRAAELAGISYRQLDYWARHSIIWPSACDAAGSGSRRLYTLRDVLRLRAFSHVANDGGHGNRPAANAVRALPDPRLTESVEYRRDKRTTITVDLSLDPDYETELIELIGAERFGE